MLRYRAREGAAAEPETVENDKGSDGAVAAGEKGPDGAAAGKLQRGLIRRLAKWAIAVLAVAVLVSGVLFYATSEHFVRHFIVPRVEKKIGRKIDFERVRIGLFSGAEIVGLTVGPAAGEQRPLLRSKRIEVRWRLLPLLRGRFDLPEATADGLDVVVVEKPERRKVHGQERPTISKKRKGKRREARAATRLLIERLEITGSSLTFVRADPTTPARTSTYTLRDVEVQAGQVGLGRPTTLSLRARLALHDPLREIAVSDGKLALDIRAGGLQQRRGATASLDGEWSLGALRGHIGRMAANNIRATGSLAIEHSRTRLVVRQADAAFFVGDHLGADIGATADINPTTREGELTFQLRHLDSSVLNLLSTARRPLDFGRTKVVARVGLKVSDGGGVFAADGNVRLTDFSILAPKVSRVRTPVTQMIARWKAVWRKAEKKLAFERLEVRTIQDGRNVIVADLARPVVFSFPSAGAIRADGETSFNLAVDRLALAQFNPFLDRRGLRFAQGTVSLESMLSTEQGGRLVSSRGQLRLEKVRAWAAGRDLGTTDLDATYDLAIGNGAIRIARLRCDVRSNGRPAGRLDGSGEISTGGKGQIDLKGRGIDLSALQVLLAQADRVRVREGIVDFDAKLESGRAGRAVDFEGKVAGKRLAFELAGRRLARFENWDTSASAELRLDRATSTVQILAASLHAGEKGLGRLRASGNGRINLKTYSGAVALDVARLDIPFLTSLLDRISTPSVGTGASSAEGVVSAKAALRFDDHLARLDASGRLQADRLKVAASEGRAAPRPADFRLTYDLAYERASRRLTLRRSTLSNAGENAGGMVGVSGTLDFDRGDLDITLEPKRFDTGPLLALATPLLGEMWVRDAIVDGRQVIRISTGKTRISAKGKLHIERLSIAAPQQSKPIIVPATDIENDVTFRKDKKMLDLGDLTVRLESDRDEIGLFRARGTLDFEKKAGDLTIESRNFEIAIFKPLLAALDIESPIVSGRLDGRQALRFASQPPLLRAKGRIRADRLMVRPPKGRRSLPPLRFDLDNDLLLSPEQTRVSSLVLSTYSGDEPLDRIELSASGGGIRSGKPMQVVVKAPTLHLDTYVAMLAASKRVKEKGEKKVAGPGSPKPRKTRVSFTIPGPPVSANIQVGKFIYDRWRVDELSVNSYLTSQGITIRSAQGRMFDGNVSAKGWFRTDVPGTAYAASVSGDNITVAQLLYAIKPRLEGKLSGKGKTQFQFSGRGLDSTSFRKALKGTGTLHIVDGEWKETPILSALAHVTKLQFLSAINFFTLDANWQIGDGTITIPQAMVVGRLHKLRIRGTVDFDQNIDLTFDLWLGGELKERLRDKEIFRYLLTESDRFLRLPVPVGMSGTLSKPLPSLTLPVNAMFNILLERGFDLLDKGLNRR